jgi:rhodanese-related sulfurtransferase
MDSNISNKQEILCAVCLLAVVSLLGTVQNWPLVQASWKGELQAILEKHRSERRAVRFEGVKTVSLDEAHTLWKGGETLIIDARQGRDYQELHVPNAINLPPESWVNLHEFPKLKSLAKESQIIVYCSQESCDDALKLANKLKTLGFNKVTAFTGGFRAWDEAGYPVDTGN